MHTPRLTLCLLAALGSVFAWTAPVTAQVDPREQIERVLDDISEQMDEIDRLLLQASREGKSTSSEAGGSSSAGESGKRVRDLIDRTQKGHDNVVKGIDELIEALNKMQGSGGGGGGQFQPGEAQRSQGQIEDQPQAGERQQSDTPDQVDQRPGQNQPQPGGQNPQDSEVPQDGQEQPGNPENRVGGTAPEGGTEQAVRDEDNRVWGRLPPYLQFLQRRGSRPELPEKYRRLREAYQKNAGREKD